MRWLSKPSDKAYGSVVVFLADHQDVETLLAQGMMDFGGEMAYTDELKIGGARCFRLRYYMR